MRTDLRLCLAQMTSARSHAANIAWVTEAARHAAGDGCALLALPEAAGLMDRGGGRALGAEADDPFIAGCRALAERHGLWIQTGSTPVLGADGRLLNHGNLIDPTGAIRARYDKIHLFDVFLEGRPPTGESERYAPGKEAVLVDTPWGPWGMTICYDLRFPQLFRAYALAGATVIFVPSAFTVPTGQAHWEVLLRARAIENGVWIVAAAQVGRHEDGRETWGHALVATPWGELAADLGSGPGLAVVDLDLAAVTRARAQIPSLKHDCHFSLRQVGAEEPGPAEVPSRSRTA